MNNKNNMSNICFVIYFMLGYHYCYKRGFFMNNCYEISLFDIIVNAILSAAGDSKRFWVKPYAAGKAIHAKKLHDLKDEEKVDFVEKVTLIHGVLESKSLLNISIKKEGARSEQTINAEIEFNDLQELKQYFNYRNELVFR